MTAEQFDAIALACDRLLLGPDATLETAAVSWLHVHNEHPVNVQKYAALGHRTPLLRRTLTAARRSRAAAVVHGMTAGRTAASHPHRRGGVLFVSHLLNPNQAGGIDFYFGDLPERLKGAGIAATVALRNHTGARPQELAPAWAGEAVPRIVLGNALPPRGELQLRRRMAAERRRLLRRPMNHESPLERQVRHAAAGEAVSFASRGDLRLYGQVRELVHRLQPDCIVVTYEGHGWERLAFHAARSVRPGIRCIGYHHTILFPRQHAIRRPLGPAWDPDVLLTVGAITRDALLESFPEAPPQLDVLGSIRAPRTRAMTTDETRDAACLVIPDGTVPECRRVFGFALECARLLPHTTFIFRTHPVLPFDAIAASTPALRTLPPNVEVSLHSIEHDVRRSRWTLYRGSSAVLAAVLGGVRPLYLDAAGELPIDPLYRLAAWRRAVAQPQDVVAVIREDQARTAPDPEARVAFEFCFDYLQSLRPDVLVRAMNPRAALSNV
jgi:hypothetical protein